MTADVHGAAQQEYLAGLRAALADLPAGEVTEILDDVGAHLAELDPDDDLVARLGPPQAYAAELRTAAGYPAAPTAAIATAPAGTGGATFALAVLVVTPVLVVLAGLAAFQPEVALLLIVLAVLLVLVALPVVVSAGPRVARVAALPAVRRFRESQPPPGSAAGRASAFLASLQPAWWLLRAVVAAALVVGALLGGGIVPTVLLALVLAPVSVWLGFRSRTDRRLLWPVVPLNAFAAVVAVAGILWVGPSSSVDQSGYSSPYLPGLWQDGERPIEDIRPVDAAGQPLSGVYLFDQDGRPIDVSGGAECAVGEGYSVRERPVQPYPRGTPRYDADTGTCVLVPAGPLVVAVPTAGPTTAPTTAVPLTTAPAAPTVQAPPTG
ncbi:hypothetical protein GCM10017691_14590 [Pseudonocardia petroleophila]|uniref:Proline-rich protein n=1 Tax=Pseudonocardia petroleophila TaxID=37331 RepID=A0A7G7MI34_9PSEU|nr:hypothetical protein [Pseudonocardia petroleophila]QNG52445.1 hypothetical protein H6H00_31265 [Pseudonocardia petroleophila]